MSRLYRTSPLLILALLVSPAPRAQQITLSEGVRAAADRITADQLARDLDYFASDELLGRNTPSHGYDRAAEYIAKRLEKAGLKPFGDNGSFFQYYTMREMHVDTGSAYLEVGGVRFRFGDDFVMRSFAGPIKASLPVVYVGHGWTIPG